MIDEICSNPSYSNLIKQEVSQKKIGTFLQEFTKVYLSNAFIMRQVYGRNHNSLKTVREETFNSLVISSVLNLAFNLIKSKTSEYNRKVAERIISEMYSNQIF